MLRISHTRPLVSGGLAHGRFHTLAGYFSSYSSHQNRSGSLSGIWIYPRLGRFDSALGLSTLMMYLSSDTRSILRSLFRRGENRIGRDQMTPITFIAVVVMLPEYTPRFSLSLWGHRVPTLLRHQDLVGLRTFHSFVRMRFSQWDTSCYIKKQESLLRK